jgi:hypothetical protein
MPCLSAVKSSNAALSLAGKSAIVVGGTSGIGKGIALRLAESRASVTIVGRNEQEGNNIVSEMESLARASNVASNGEEEPKFDFVRCDASLIANIKVCSETLIENKRRLDILVLSQGIASVDGYTPTSEGLERKLAVHYYGRIAFIKCLLPLMTATTENPKVLSVLSGGVHAPYAGYESDPDLAVNFSIKNAADAAGFYNDIGLDMLSKQNPKATFFHSAPGVVQTNWGSEFPWYLKGPLRLFQSFARSMSDCAEYHFFSLAKESYTQGGFYIVDQNAELGKVTELHEAATESVWNHTTEVLAKYGVE